MSDLDKAYALNGPEDCARLYAEWAASYDTGFAKENDYLLPAHVAAAFLAHGGSGPVLDVGAGTGLLALALRESGFSGQVDALDLSAEMLAKAAEKGLYRSLYPADITGPIDLPEKYRGFVSSGTFTHGHVGPEAFDHLEALAAPGALFAMSINAGVFAASRFDKALALRRDVSLLDVPIYGSASQNAAHAADRAIIALWRTSA